MSDVKPVLDFRLMLEIASREGVDKGIIIADEYADPRWGLDIDFDITKSYDTKPQSSKITIYNLSRQIYNKIYEEADAFRLSCARGENTSYVPFFTGYPVKALQVSKQTVLTSNQGFMAQDANAGRRGQNDLQTEITLMNYGFAKLYTSYQTSVSSELVINDCITALGLPKGNIDKYEDVELPAGYTIRGDVSTALNDLGKRCGFKWNTNDMKFNIYAANRDDIKTYGVILTPDNSSTPERQDDTFKTRVEVIQQASKKKGIKGIKATHIEKTEKGYMLKTQLLPFMQIGSTCRLQDFGLAGADGDKYVYKLHHVGNNYGTECYTELYCV